MTKYILIALGTVFLAIGCVGLVVPGLPTTPFLLLSAALYVRSSRRLYSWLLNHKLFGKMVRDFRENRSISLRSKVISIVTMWAMILLSVLVFIEKLGIKMIVTGLGVVGTVVLLLLPLSRKHPQ